MKVSKGRIQMAISVLKKAPYAQMDVLKEIHKLLQDILINMEEPVSRKDVDDLISKYVQQSVDAAYQSGIEDGANSG